MQNYVLKYRASNRLKELLHSPQEFLSFDQVREVAKKEMVDVRELIIGMKWERKEVALSRDELKKKEKFNKWMDRVKQKLENEEYRKLIQNVEVKRKDRSPFQSFRGTLSVGLDIMMTGITLFVLGFVGGMGYWGQENIGFCIALGGIGFIVGFIVDITLAVIRESKATKMIDNIEAKYNRATNARKFRKDKVTKITPWKPKENPSGCPDLADNVNKNSKTKQDYEKNKKSKKPKKA